MIRLSMQSRGYLDIAKLPVPTTRSLQAYLKIKILREGRGYLDIAKTTGNNHTFRDIVLNAQKGM